MKITNTLQLSQEQKEQILQLWNNEYPEKLAYKSIDGFENYLEKLNEVDHFLLMNDDLERFKIFRPPSFNSTLATLFDDSTKSCTSGLIL
jgi:hypothetical protein